MKGVRKRERERDREMEDEMGRVVSEAEIKRGKEREEDIFKKRRKKIKLERRKREGLNKMEEGLEGRRGKDEDVKWRSEEGAKISAPLSRTWRPLSSLSFLFSSFASLHRLASWPRLIAPIGTFGQHVCRSLSRFLRQTLRGHL